MSFSKTLAELKAPKIYKLVLDNSGHPEIKGLRVRVCKSSRGRGIPTINYYDFLIKYVKDKEIQVFLKDNLNKFETIPLILGADNVCMTQDEIDGKIVVSEFENSKDTLAVLSLAYNYYKKNQSEE